MEATVFGVLRSHLINHKANKERVKGMKKIVGWRVYPKDGMPEQLPDLPGARMYAETIGSNLIKAVFAQA